MRTPYTVNIYKHYIETTTTTPCRVRPCSTVFDGILCNKKPQRAKSLFGFLRTDNHEHTLICGIRSQPPAERARVPYPSILYYGFYTHARTHTPAEPQARDRDRTAPHRREHASTPLNLYNHPGGESLRASEVSPEPERSEGVRLQRCRLKLGYLCNACVSRFVWQWCWLFVYAIILGGVFGRKWSTTRAHAGIRGR